ncbi:TIGR03915 family putative DNA repair protein [Anaerolentibacter hominis]|uniref:TIGR03915 family putative DNA repair protein n=1 Tax=Anaerolentibacter hominis TaxID=3079009 RepID=UPI0031B80910
MMKPTRIYLCEDSVDGILTGIYEGWMSRYGHDYVKIKVNQQETLELFSEYVTVAADEEKSQKVGATIRRKIGTEGYNQVIRALLSDDPDKADTVYRFLIRGFAVGPSIIQQLGFDCVRRVMEMNRRVGNEAHYHVEFIRFSQLKNGILFSKITPKSDVLTLVAPHFADRLALENFMIYDSNRKKAVLHRADFPWILTDASEFDEAAADELAEEETDFIGLWKHFVKHIAIMERKNERCQNNMLPKRYRPNMTEFDPRYEHIGE